MTNKKKGRIVAGTVMAGILLALYLLSRKGVAAPPAPQMRYSCSGEPDYICSEDINGTYSAIAECEASCTSLNQTIDIIIEEI